MGKMQSMLIHPNNVYMQLDAVEWGILHSQGVPFIIGLPTPGRLVEG